MLIYILLKGFFVIFNWALLAFNLVATAFLPKTMPANWLSGLSVLSPVWNEAQSFFPVDQFLLIAQLMVGLELVLFLYERMVWVLSKIPFMGGK